MRLNFLLPMKTWLKILSLFLLKQQTQDGDAYCWRHIDVKSCPLHMSGKLHQMGPRYHEGAIWNAEVSLTNWNGVMDLVAETIQAWVLSLPSV